MFYFTNQDSKSILAVCFYDDNMIGMFDSLWCEVQGFTKIGTYYNCGDFYVDYRYILIFADEFTEREKIIKIATLYKLKSKNVNSVQTLGNYAVRPKLNIYFKD